MYDPITEGGTYEDAFASRPKKKAKTYTNDPSEADITVAQGLSKAQAWVELLFGGVSFFALVLSFAIMAGEVATGGLFSRLWPNTSLVWGVSTVVGIDMMLVATAAQAAWAGKARKFGKMLLWMLASAPSAALAYVQARVYGLENVTHLSENAALKQIGMDSLSYTLFRALAGLALIYISAWIAKEAWFAKRELPVARVNQHDGYYRPRNKAKIRRTRNGKGTMAPVSVPFDTATR